MQKTILGEFTFARIHAGPAFALVRIQENIVEELFSEYFAIFLGEIILVQMHATPGFAPVRTQEKLLAN